MAGGGGGGSASGGSSSNGSSTPVTNVTCSASGNATGIAAANCYIAEMTATGGSQVTWAGTSSLAWSSATSLLATSTANTYSIVRAEKQVSALNNPWTSSPNTPGSWELTASGWLEWTISPPSFIEMLYNNQDGTLRISDQSVSYTLDAIAKTDLSGQAVVCNSNQNFLSGVGSFTCPTPTNYPTGAAAYTANRISLVDSYQLLDNAINGAADVLTDSAGNALTSLPAVGTTACISGTVFVPISPAPAAGSDNYNLHATSDGSCGAAVITTAMGGTPVTTALVAAKTVYGVPMLTIKQGTSKLIAAFNAQAANRFMTGIQFRTAGAILPVMYVNKAAANAQMTAHNIAVLP